MHLPGIAVILSQFGDTPVEVRIVFEGITRKGVTRSFHRIVYQNDTIQICSLSFLG